LLGVTTHITADIASAPLLWVVPLMLYLLTFILAFARRPPLRHSIMVRVLPLVLIPLVITTAPGLPLMLPLPLMLALHLGCFFAVAMVCHGELARQRPPTAQLTEFYFFLSIGGVLGGAFNALLAPLIFSSVWEYPLALIAACLVKPSAPDDARHGLTRDVLLPFALLGLVLLTNAIRSIVADGTVLLLLVATFGYMLPALALLNFSPRRWRFALGVAVMLFATAATGASDTIAAYRSFFGVYRIRAVDEALARAGSDERHHAAWRQEPGARRGSAADGLLQPTRPVRPVLCGVRSRLHPARRGGRAGNRRPRLLCPSRAALDVL
jgi:hypothetical protein